MLIKQPSENFTENILVPEEKNNPFRKEKFASVYDKLLQAPFTRQIRQEETKALTRIFLEKLSKEDSVLEIGAGTGSFSIAIASLVKYLTALEPSHGMARQLRKKKVMQQVSNIEIREEYFEKYNSASKFDHVIAIGVMDYITMPSVFIERCLSLSAKSFIFTTPHRGFWTAFYKFGSLFQRTTIYRYSEDELKKLCHGSVLQVTDVGLKSAYTGGFTLICVASPEKLS